MLKKDAKPIIFLADKIDPDGIKLLQKKFELIFTEGKTARQLLDAIKKKSNPDLRVSALLIRSTRKIDKVFAQELAAIGGVRLICTVSAGYDNIDINECRKHGIDVLNVEGANSTSAAEFTIAMILNSYKSIISADTAMKRGKFDFSVYRNHELSGKTIGIIGVGQVGSKAAKFARAFRMKVLGNDIDPAVRNRHGFIKFVSLNALLKSCDIVTIHTPLDHTTRNLINSANIRLMKKHSLLVNTSRGGIVNERALKSRLKSDNSFFAAMDVFENEPHFDKEFARLSNVIITPHLAGKTLESRKKMSIIAAENLLKYFGKSRSLLKFVN